MIRFSFYDNILNNKSETTITENEFITNFLSQPSEIIEKIRSSNDPETINVLKKELPAVTFAGQFIIRRQNEPFIPTGLIVVDIDKLEELANINNILKNDKYTRLLFISPSGKGLKIIVQIPQVKDIFEFKSRFNSLKTYYLDKYNISIDTSGSDVTRLCFISYDTNYYYNPDASVYTKIDKNSNEISPVDVSKRILDFDSIVDIMIPYWKVGQRQNVSLYLSAFLRASGWGIKTVLKCVKLICDATHDSDFSERSTGVYTTFDKDKQDIKGYTGLKEIMEKDDFFQICKILNYSVAENKKQVFVYKYKKKHLPYFDLLVESLGLIGQEYNTTRKALYYHLIGLMMKSDSAFNFGSVRFDSRVNLYFMLNSGSGKNNFKQLLRNSLPTNISVKEATSFHQEQLIGKIVGKDKNMREARGYFDNDELIFDESRQLFMNENNDYVSIRSYFCLALDPIGSNTISKQLTEHGNQHPLRYNARCSIILFTQPINFATSVIESGFMRRGIPLYIPANNNTANIVISRLMSCDLSTKYAELRKRLTKLRGFLKHKTWTSDDIIPALDKYFHCLLAYGLSYSDRVGLYVSKIYQHTLLDTLLKFAYIHAGSQQRTHVTIEDVKIAYMDLYEILGSVFSAIDTFSPNFYNFDLTYPENEGLQWLYDNQAINEQSPITVAMLVSIIAEHTETTQFNVRKKELRNLKNNGYIKIKRGQSGSSSVYLTEKGLSLFKHSDNNNNCNHYAEYLKICEELKKHDITNDGWFSEIDTPEEIEVSELVPVNEFD